MELGAINALKAILKLNMLLIMRRNQDIRDVICGVPQGSILGAVLFLIYINGLASVSIKLYYVLSADDTNVFISGNNLKKLINTLHIELDNPYA